MRRWWFLPIALAIAVVGCFDSLVSGTCESGYAMSKGVCVVHTAVIDGGVDTPTDTIDSGIIDTPPDGRIDGGVDAAPDSAIDAAPDAAIDAAPDAAIDAAPDAAIDAAPDAPIDAAIDAAIDAPVDAAPDAPSCSAPSQVCRGMCTDVMTDPDNCGGCGRICASGVCEAGLCAGALRGHIVAIGHDYRSFHPAMARVLGNAVALGAHYDIGVARWTGTSGLAAQRGTTAAIAASLPKIGRPWHDVALPAEPSPSALQGLDVLVIDAQQGDGDAAQAAGQAWLAPITSFVAAGGVVVVLEGSSGVSYRFAQGAGLYTIAAPIDITSQLAFVVDGAEVTTQQVVSPYLAETTSVSLPGAPPAAISTLLGGPIVFHITR